MKWISIELTSLNSNEVQTIYINGKKLLLVSKEESFFVFASKCPHAGADLSGAWCKGDFLVCPVHRYQYQLLNGRGAPGQGDYLKNYPTKIENGKLWIGFKKPWFRFW